MLRRTQLISAFSSTSTLLRTMVIKMPALSPTMEKGTLVAWDIKIGDKIEENTCLAKVQTDKATNDFNYVGDECFLARIVHEAGSVVTVGEPVAIAVDDKAELESDEVKNWKPKSAAAAAAPTPAAASTSSSSSNTNKQAAAAPAATSAGNNGRVFASPAARKVASELGVSLSGLTGTGGAIGRITKDDVIAQAKTAAANQQQQQTSATPAAAKSAVSAPVSSFYEDIVVTPMRSIIAQRLHQSKNVEVPHYYLMNDYRADSMLKVIKHLNEKADGKYKISVNDFIIKCVARANLAVPECNTHWHGDFMRRYQTVDVSVAVATPTGLITPIIKNAHVKGLAQISNETKELAKKAREGTLKPEEFQGGTISVSNLGAMGVDRFTAIINPPQSTILAVGQSRPMPEFTKNADGTFASTGAVQTVISFTASFDHRVVDGAIGAQWFKHFGEAFENPLSLML